MTTGRINQDLQTHRSRRAGFASLFFCALFGPKESGDKAVTSGDMLGGLEFAAFPARKRSPLSTENLRIWRLGHPTCSPTRKTDSLDSTVLSAFLHQKRSRMER